MICLAVEKPGLRARGVHDGKKNAANASFFAIVCILCWFSAKQAHSVAHLKFSIEVAAGKFGPVIFASYKKALFLCDLVATFINKKNKNLD